MVGEAAGRPPRTHVRVQEEVKRCLAVSLCLVALVASGCKGGSDEIAAPSPASELARARSLIHPYDFGDRFQRGISLLRSLPKAEGVGKDVAMDALLLSAEALTDLFLAARATGDPELAESLKAATNWDLEGDLSIPKNLQILVQEIQETFDLVHRELGDDDPRGARAARMAGFLRDVQAVVFVKKDRLIQTLAALDTAVGVQGSHRAALVRLGEIFRPGPRTWRDHVLTTLGFPCPRAASGLMMVLCLPDPNAEVRGQCLMEGVAHNAERRAAAGGILGTRCDDLEAGTEGTPQAAVRAWYQAQIETIKATDAPLASWLREHIVDQWETGLDAALAPAFALTQSD